VPFVVSMSYSFPENEQCEVGTCNGISDEQYVQETEAKWLQISLRGVTLVASSGDLGAPGDSNSDCTNTKEPINNGYPGTSAYVLSIGATMLDEPVDTPTATTFQSPICQTESCATSTTELVCTYPTALITSGGGFSTYIPRPAWQDQFVSSYLKSGATFPPSQFYNATNRAFPDVAALGHNYLIRIDGIWEPVDGTSCSTPVWGGIISLLNSRRFNLGKSSIGFINQAIYQAYAQNAKAFTDLTSGNNKCTEECCATYGFEAVVGWDATTGLGTPVFPLLESYFASLQ